MNALATPLSTGHDTASGISFLRRPAHAARPAGLVVLLHGVGGNETNLIPLAHALPADLEVLLARGPLTLGPAQHAWFQVSFGGEGPRINPLQAETARRTLIGFLASQQARTGVAAESTLIAGFSQGGIMSASVALSTPASLAGFGLLSGRILPEIEALIAPHAALRHLHAYISHGDQDSRLPPFWADQAAAWLERLGVSVEARRYPADHEITPAMLHDFVAWVTQRLDTRPVRLRFDADSLRLGEGDAQIDLAAGARRIATRHFHASPPRPVELENAIQDIEDALLPADGRFASHTLTSDEAWLGELASLAGAAPGALGRDAVESLFGRLAALSEGRPLSQDGMPVEPLFAARLLILRELMHHLDFRMVEAG